MVSVHDNMSSDISTVLIIPTEEQLLYDAADLIATSVTLPEDSARSSWALVSTLQFLVYQDEYISLVHQIVSRILVKLYHTAVGCEDRIVDTYSKDPNIHVFRFWEFDEFVDDVNHQGCITIKINQPTPAQCESHEERERFWESSNHMLMLDSVIYFVWKWQAEERHLVPLVFSATLIHRKLTLLSSNHHHAHIWFHLHDSRSIAHLVDSELGRQQWYIISISNLYSGAFVPILKVLQNHTKHGELIPFQDVFAQPENYVDVSTDINWEPGLPKFTKVPSFSYNMSWCWPGLRLYPNNLESKEQVQQALQSHARHDHDQADAIIQGLLHDLSVVQGYVYLFLFDYLQLKDFVSGWQILAASNL